MPGARAGIFVDALLRHEGGLPVDEVGQFRGVAHRRRAAENVKANP